MVSIVSTPQGIERVNQFHPEVEIVTGAVDEGLDARAFIVPGTNRQDGPRRSQGVSRSTRGRERTT